jgi:hypothetical protein
MTNNESTQLVPLLRNFQWKSPIPACKLDREDIKRLYRIIDDKQTEDRDYLVNYILQLQPNESPADFDARKDRVRDACRTTITVTGTRNNEAVVGHGEGFLDSSIIPEKIATIYFDTQTRFTALLNIPRTNWASVLLDFTSPSPLDWVALPSSPTPNNSIYTINAQNEAWASSLNARLDKFFTERKTGWNWLHRQAIYDFLLFVFALPLVLWAESRLGLLFIEPKQLPFALSIGIYVYVFFFFVNVFRMIFSYARWAFPKIELESAQSSVATHRAILVALLIGIIGSAVWDALKAIW